MFALVVMVVAACEVSSASADRRDVPPAPAAERRRDARPARMSATDFGWLILLFPLVGSVVIALGWRILPARTAGGSGPWRSRSRSRARSGCSRPSSTAPRKARTLTSTLYDYATSVGLEIDMNIYVDPLACVMCLVVTGVSMLIHLYSVAYLDSDRGYARFFSYLNFFVFSMLLLVLAGNFVLLIVGWAFVGFASYALISFWYRRGTATAAGMKAFVINVIGDVGPRPGGVPDLPRARRLQLPRGLRVQPRSTSRRTTARSSRSASCSWSARSRSPPSCRSTPGFRTRWRAPRRSPR